MRINSRSRGSSTSWPRSTTQTQSRPNLGMKSDSKKSHPPTTSSLTRLRRWRTTRQGNLPNTGGTILLTMTLVASGSSRRRPLLSTREASEHMATDSSLTRSGNALKRMTNNTTTSITTRGLSGPSKTELMGVEVTPIRLALLSLRKKATKRTVMYTESGTSSSHLAANQVARCRQVQPWA